MPWVTGLASMATVFEVVCGWFCVFYNITINAGIAAGPSVCRLSAISLALQTFAAMATTETSSP